MIKASEIMPCMICGGNFDAELAACPHCGAARLREIESKKYNYAAAFAVCSAAALAVSLVCSGFFIYNLNNFFKQFAEADLVELILMFFPYYWGMALLAVGQMFFMGIAFVGSVCGTILSAAALRRRAQRARLWLIMSASVTAICVIFGVFAVFSALK